MVNLKSEMEIRMPHEKFNHSPTTRIVEHSADAS
jgi:hypothetical protein